MLVTVPFDPTRFTSAVPHYVAGRPRYAPKLIERLALECNLSASSRVLDLGCGPGFLAIPLAAYSGHVIGIDPDPAMLDAARLEASAAGIEVEWRTGSSLDLGDDLAALDLVVMGRSFHWMDRQATLARLDALVRIGGTVALLHTDTVPANESRWYDRFEAMRKEFGREDDFHEFRRSSEWERHVVVLLRSAFSDVSRISVFDRRISTIDDLVARALSHSGSSPKVLGARLATFERALREKLLALRPDGQFPEYVESSAVIARRPKGDGRSP